MYYSYAGLGQNPWFLLKRKPEEKKSVRVSLRMPGYGRMRLVHKKLIPPAHLPVNCSLKLYGREAMNVQFC